MAAYETREQWGSREDDPAGYRIGRVSEVIAHHFWRPHVPSTATHSDERATMRSVQRGHTDDNGWDDIAYQFVVFQSGRGYEGRGWFRTGAHTAGRNSKSVGIAFAINGDDHTPTDKAWETARQIAAEGIQVGALTDDYTLSGHQDYANYKSCPGDKTYPIIGEHLSSSLIDVEEEDMEKVPQPEWLPDDTIDKLLRAKVLTSRPDREPYVVWRMYAYLKRTLDAVGDDGRGGLQRGDTVKLQ